MDVSRGFNVMDSFILSLLVLVQFKEEVGLSSGQVGGERGGFFLAKLLGETQISHLVLDQLGQLRLHVFNFLVVA